MGVRLCVDDVAERDDKRVVGHDSGLPSTTRVSLENAFMLSLDLALARLASRLGTSLGPTSARTRATSDSASRWAYQTPSSV